MAVSRTRMELYLRNHFRYDTMHSWNRATSYARNVKLHHLNLDAETRSSAYDFLELPEAYWEVNALIEEFDRHHDYRWQAGFNGRSGGYIVLYQGGKRETGYKTSCDTCGKLTWYKTEQSCHMDGCDGTLRLLTEKHYEVFTYPGKGLDEDEDFSAWGIDELRDRYRLVREFDELCEACVKAFIEFVKTHHVEEKTISVPKTVRVAVPVHNAD